MRFHLLHTDIEKPQRFTYPFDYEPHPLCLQAADEVVRHIEKGHVWTPEAKNGKMFGVLVVENQAGELGFLAAYSGNMSGRNDWDFFVTPVYNLLRRGGYFAIHEREITDINRRVEALEGADEYRRLVQCAEQAHAEARQQIADYQALLGEAKQKRRQIRLTIEAEKGLSRREHQEIEQRLIGESQFLKAEFHRLKLRMAEQTATHDRALAAYQERIDSLKAQRHLLSDKLQRWTFSHYSMLNARGERRNLLDIFAHTRHGQPPAGAGECCAPKLLQYAYRHHLHPVCMAEFWYGRSPKAEIRHHLHFYPACRSKCRHILAHMLQGLDVDPDLRKVELMQQLSIIYEDDYLIAADKPSGLLSVPGQDYYTSVYSLMRERYPSATGPLTVHRLDMATSGIILLAKSKETHSHLQQQFVNREVKKTYIALVEGVPAQREGRISLPIRPDLDDRPRQIVDHEHGKQAVTEYRMVGQEGGRARLELRPLTGRTHQLRVHCAHAEGLNLPIVGDELYGRRGERLLLHAHSITFRHPATGEWMTLKSPIPF